MTSDPKTIPLYNGIHSAIHRFGEKPADQPLLLIHGSIEDSRIFHSRSGKGLAPYLASQGFDVFAPDLAGKGMSQPRIHKGFEHSQQDFIERDLNLYLAHIQTIHPGKRVGLVAHSWGGVLLLAWMARYAPLDALGPAVFFASKRRIAVRSLRRLFMVDLMWTLGGEVGTALKGYLPAKAMGMGSDNEPAQFYREVNRWVYRKDWVGRDGFDYRAALQQKQLPPILYLAGAHDRVLGHPHDVQRLMHESGQSTAQYLKLGLDTGFRRNYGHIDILTDPHCPDDHFPLAGGWLRFGHLGKA